ncbi:MAG: hypothetical protein ABI124_05105, partial [Terrimesophilobacter sp.]
MLPEHWARRYTFEGILARINHDAQDVAARTREVTAISPRDGIEFNLCSIRTQTFRKVPWVLLTVSPH